MKQPSSKQGPGPLRKAAFYVLTILLVYGLLEGISLAAYAIVSEDSFSFATLQTRRSRVIHAPWEPVTDSLERKARRFRERGQVIHPYVGFVIDPTSDAGRSDINEYGFYGPPPPIGRMNENTDTLFVAVLGGSVANALVDHAGGTFSRELQKVAPFAGKKIFISRLALPAMKQPQQLMTLNYFMSLGARFDLIINLDGFNDIVISDNNARRHIFPFYPNLWKQRVAGLGDQDLLRKAGRLAYLESIRHFLARLGSRVPFKYSVTANVFWEQADQGLWKWIEDKRVTLTQEVFDRDRMGESGATFAGMGPSRTYASDEARYADLAAYWGRSSVLLHGLARVSGAHYFHFLQPNQHVPDSKIFSDAERAIVQPREYGSAQAVREGYPYLIETGGKLVEEGVSYTDLTMLFADNDEVLYADACCHFNTRGYELVAMEIARVIRETLDAR